MKIQFTRILKFRLALIVFNAVNVSAALADRSMTERCMEDKITPVSEAAGRNAWARKCGYISVRSESVFNEDGNYITFVNSTAPKSEADACIAGLVRLGNCMTGCYSPTQRLEFSGALVSIENAFKVDLMTVTALSQNSAVNAMRFAEQPIKSFVAGNTKENLYVIEAGDGLRLEVTSEHPMVRDDGQIIKARAVRSGSKLLAADGGGVTVTSVQLIPYEGKVWNIQPVSKIKSENIFNAEGLLTGSVRFQNEWADELYRLNNRDGLDVSGI